MYMETATFHEPPHILLEGGGSHDDQGLDTSSCSVGRIQYGLRLPPIPRTNPLVRPRPWNYTTSATTVSAAARGTTRPEVVDENQCHQAAPQETTTSVHDVSFNTSFFATSRLASTSMTSLTSEDDLERSYCYKFSSLQRQLFQNDMEKMKTRVHEMKGKGERMRERYLELRQKRLSLGDNRENWENNDLNVSKDAVTQTTLPGVVTSEGGSTSGAPIAPPRRNSKAKVRWGGGRTDPYGAGGQVLPRRRMVGPQTPAEEMNRLIHSLQSGKKTRAPSRPVQAPGTMIQAPDCQIQVPDRPTQAPDCHIQAPDRHIQAPNRHIQAPNRHIQACTQAGGERLLQSRGEVRRLGSTHTPVSMLTSTSTPQPVRTSHPGGVLRSNTVCGPAHRPPCGSSHLKGILRASSISYPASSTKQHPASSTTTQSPKLFQSIHSRTRSILGSINSNNKTSTPLSMKHVSAAKTLSSIAGPPPTHYLDMSMFSFHDGSFTCASPKATTEWSMFDVSHTEESEDRPEGRIQRKGSEARRVGLHRRTKSGNKIYPMNLLNQLDMSTTAS